MAEDDLEMDDESNMAEAPNREVPHRYLAWWRKDYDAQAAWRKEAKEAYDFVSGRQWDPDDAATLDRQGRPAITFNRVEVMIDAISGNEILNRNQVTYYAREEGDAIPSEIYTEAARWFDDQAEAPAEDTDAFRDTLITGVGCTETTVSFDEDPDGLPDTNRIDPLEMCWDKASSKPNFLDARRVWRMRQFDLKEAREMFPGVDDSDLDATGWLHSDSSAPTHTDDPSQWYETEANDIEDTYKRKPVTILHLQWYEMEDYYRVADPITESIVSMDVKEYEEFQKKLKPLGVQLKAAKQKRRVYKQAFIGRVLLKEGMAPSQTGFTYKFITGKRDRNKNMWYGPVRAMVDPARWSNKWLSQLLHIINSNAKGGLMIENSAVQGGDIRRLEDNWASPEGIVTVSDGAIAGGKLKERPAAQFPAGYFTLTEFAIRAIREVSGVSMEMLGLRETNQSGVLENSRKQAGMAVLAAIFDNLRRYRKARGTLLLDYIENFLADGRLVRVVGKDKAKYVPLLKQTNAKYDVVVDESPHSPDAKEKIWQSMVQILPGVKDIIPPEVLLDMLSYSPLPATVVANIKETVAGLDEKNREKAQLALKAAMVEMAQKEADVEKTKSETLENQADMALKQARAQDIAEKTPVELESKMVDTRKAFMEAMDEDKNRPARAGSEPAVPAQK